MIMKKKEGKKQKEKSKKWAGPAHQAAHVPLALLEHLESFPSLKLPIHASSVVALPPGCATLHPSAPLWMHCFASLRPSTSSPSLIKEQIRCPANKHRSEYESLPHPHPQHTHTQKK